MAPNTTLAQKNRDRIDELILPHTNERKDKRADIGKTGEPLAIKVQETRRDKYTLIYVDL